MERAFSRRSPPSLVIPATSGPLPVRQTRDFRWPRDSETAVSCVHRLLPVVLSRGEGAGWQLPQGQGEDALPSFISGTHFRDSVLANVLTRWYPDRLSGMCLPRRRHLSMSSDHSVFWIAAHTTSSTGLRRLHATQASDRLLPKLARSRGRDGSTWIQRAFRLLKPILVSR
jgi:hypothetical protein